MAAFEAPRPAPFGAESVYALVTLAERAADALRRLRHVHAVRRATRAQLRAMNVRMLDDLGLAGWDVDRSVARRFR